MPGKISTSIAAPAPRRLSRAEAIQTVEAELAWDVGLPEDERRQGYQEGTYVALHKLNDRAELLRILDALDCGQTEFLIEFQQAEFIASTPAGIVKLELLEAHLFGAASGGINGPYGCAYLAALRATGPFVNSLH